MNSNQDIKRLVEQDYQHGFITEVEADTVAPGLNEDIVRFISAKKNEPEFLLKWRLKAYHSWLDMEEPHWASVHHELIDYQSISYYSPAAPPPPKSLDELAPELLETCKKPGTPLGEQKPLAGVSTEPHKQAMKITAL